MLPHVVDSMPGAGSKPFRNPGIWALEAISGGRPRRPLLRPQEGRASCNPCLLPRGLQKRPNCLFCLELERPRKVRLEVQFEGKTAIQVYDGAGGWKVRPYLNRVDVESFTPEELKLASMQSDLDGPLVNYEAKGTRVELVGMENVEDRPTYKLALTTKTGEVIHVWIDAETFLEAKIDGQPRKLDGKMHAVEIYYKDYRKVDGLQIPFLLVTKVLPSENASPAEINLRVPPEQIVVDKVVVNPKLDAARFSKPEIKAAATGHQGL